MSYSEPQSFGGGAAAPSQPRNTTPIEVLVERLRLALGIGLVVLVLLFAAFGERSAPDSATETSVNQTAVPSETEFDGRGKWGGYAR